MLKAAGFGQIEMTVAQLNLLLPKLAEFVPHHISATPMAAGYERADEPAQQSIIRDITETLSQYETNGHVQIPFKSHLIMTEK